MAVRNELTVLKIEICLQVKNITWHIGITNAIQIENCLSHSSNTHCEPMSHLWIISWMNEIYGATFYLLCYHSIARIFTCFTEKIKWGHLHSTPSNYFRQLSFHFSISYEILMRESYQNCSFNINYRPGFLIFIINKKRVPQQGVYFLSGHSEEKIKGECVDNIALLLACTHTFNLSLQHST